MPLPDHLGRMRVNEAELRILYRLLVSTRFAVLYQRVAARDEGDDIHAFQRELLHLKRLREEVLLLARQKEWDIGQSVIDDSEGADPALPPSTPRRVG